MSITDDVFSNEREVMAAKSLQAVPAGSIKLYHYQKTFTITQYNDSFAHSAWVEFTTNDGTTPVVCWGITTQEHNITWQPLNKIYDKPYFYQRFFESDRVGLSVSYGFPQNSTASSVSITFTVHVYSTTEGSLNVQIT